jgi:hypothetical protein
VNWTKTHKNSINNTHVRNNGKMGHEMVGTIKIEVWGNDSKKTYKKELLIKI